MALAKFTYLRERKHGGYLLADRFAEEAEERRSGSALRGAPFTEYEIVDTLRGRRAVPVTKAGTRAPEAQPDAAPPGQTPDERQTV